MECWDAKLPELQIHDQAAGHQSYGFVLILAVECDVVLCSNGFFMFGRAVNESLTAIISIHQLTGVVSAALARVRCTTYAV